MEKFSIYDLLGLLLPGVIFLYFFSILTNIFGIHPELSQALDWKTNIGISLCFALIIGAALYTANFYLVKKVWYNRLFGMYKNITCLYFEMEGSLVHMNETLNQKAKEWYKKDIYFEKTDFDKFTEKEKEENKKIRGKYYSRMYSELVYHDKIKYSITFQSFYFFFRQTALACMILLVIGIMTYGLSFMPCSCLNTPSTHISLWLSFLLVALLFIAIRLAAWYRKRMVSKMYWTYFTHLNQN